METVFRCRVWEVGSLLLGRLRCYPRCMVGKRHLCRPWMCDPRCRVRGGAVNPANQVM